jgi:hypothetical protein
MKDEIVSALTVKMFFYEVSRKSGRSSFIISTYMHLQIEWKSSLHL